MRPAAVGWNEEKLQAALTFAGECNSSGVVVLHRGKILAERYWDLNASASGKKDAAGRSIEHVASIRKSVIAILMGMARHHGSLRLEETVSKHLGAGWSKAAKEQEQLITVRHLLTMTSGLADDMTFEAAAGTRWRYNNAACGQTLLVLAAAEKQSISGLTRTWLTSRIGMGDSSWVAPVEPPGGDERLQFWTTARDLARFGLLMLADGRWKGEDVIADRAYLRAALQPSQPLNPAYGYLWWRNGQAWFLRGAGDRTEGPLIPAAPADLFSAHGAQEKKLYVVPSLDLVVTRLGKVPGPAILPTFPNEFWKRLMAAAPRP